MVECLAAFLGTGDKHRGQIDNFELAFDLLQGFRAGGLRHCGLDAHAGHPQSRGGTNLPRNSVGA